MDESETDRGDAAGRVAGSAEWAAVPRGTETTALPDAAPSAPTAARPKRGGERWRALRGGDAEPIAAVLGARGPRERWDGEALLALSWRRART